MHSLSPGPKVLSPIGLQSLAPSHDVAMTEWWLHLHAGLTVPADVRKGLDCLVLLVCWFIPFGRKLKQPLFVEYFMLSPGYRMPSLS